MITENDLYIYKYLDGLRKEAIQRGKNEEAEMYYNKKCEVNTFIESIKTRENPIYQDVYCAMKYHYIYGLTLRCTASKMNCGEATVSRHIKRGHKLIKSDSI